MSQKKLTIKNVRVEYLNSTRSENVVGIKNISLEIKSGELLALLGPSGCGKTTLLKAIADILPLSSGTIQLGGKSISLARQNNSLGFVPQFFALLPHLSVENNILLPLAIHGLDAKGRLEDLLSTLKLTKYRNYFPSQLSGGLQQRVAIARALIYQPELLLLDEPFASLDEIMREDLDHELIRICHKYKQTVVFVTHNVEEAVSVADRICVMVGQPGEIVEIIDNTDILASKEIRSEMRFIEKVAKVRLSLRKAINV